MKRKLSVLDLLEMKRSGKKVAWVTAYDYWTAQFAETADMDMLLVGDSLGMNVYGYESTIPVTMDQCICHAEAVRRGAPNTFVIGDMPFLSYQVSDEESVRNAGRFFQEARVDAIKLEGGIDFAPTIEAIVKAGIPVQGHIGLTPQTASALGGFKMQGRDALAAKRIIEDARALEDAGVFSMILEAVPAPLGQLVAEAVKVPVIGIGAGPNVDGQVLVTHDMIGLFDKFVPTFVKQYAQIRKTILEALREYKEDVLTVTFPGPEHSFKMPDDALEQLKKLLNA